jgi:proteic killer suppression protein
MDMIRSFKCEKTRHLSLDLDVKEFRSIERVARRKLEMLEVASDLMDLRSPPGNRLESLKGSRKGQYSIRINDQYRICFRWEHGDVLDVEIVDYHK